MYISNTTRTLAIVFLFITLVYSYPSKDIVSHGLSSSNPDNSFITKTTDCITSMMTSTIIGTDADCFNILDIKDYNSKYNVSAVNDINSPSKNNSVYFNFQNLQNKANAIATAIPTGAANPVNASPVSSFAPPLPPPDNPSTLANPVNASPVSSSAASLPPPVNPLESISSQQQDPSLSSANSSNTDTTNDNDSSDGGSDGSDNDSSDGGSDNDDGNDGDD